MTVDQAYQRALQHHQAGRQAEAEALYRQIVAVAPQHAETWHMLGLLVGQMGMDDMAMELMLKAVVLKPTVTAFHSNLGAVYGKLGRLEEAVASYRRALDLEPDLPEAHYNLGNALKEQGHMGEAMAAYRRAVQLRPTYADAHNNLGNLLQADGCLDEAIAAFSRVLALKPNLPEVHNNLGNALSAKDCLDEALEAYDRALQIKPDYPEALFNLGHVLSEKGRGDEAIAVYQRVLEIKPDYADAHYDLGNTLKKEGRISEAIAAYERVLRIKPDHAEACNNLGVALMDHGRIAGVLVALSEALRLKPGWAMAHSNLLLNHHYLAGDNPEALFAEHRRWDKIHAEPLAGFIEPHSNSRDPDRRLRVGYVSRDFRAHSVAFFVEGLLAQHDPEKMEVYCYSDLMLEDEVSARLRGHVAQWRRIKGMKDEQLAALIRQDGIDILVDLAGHTANNRLLVFARKPAPVQVTWLGYPNTTGMTVMDYRLTDAHADPPGATEHLHTEKLVRMPESAWCFRPSDRSPPVEPLPALRAGRITFGCFSAMAKMDEAILREWARLLLAVPGSRLLLKNLGLGDRSMRQRTLALLTGAGVGSERVEMMGRTPDASDHLATYSRVDIALDTFPYHGTTTTCEALWMGVPVVTLAGATHVSRVGVSILNNLGLPDLVAQSDEDYVRIAAGLAGDIPRLNAWRASLRARMAASPLMDASRFARNVESAYRAMWRNWCEGATPSGHHP